MCNAEGRQSKMIQGKNSKTAKKPKQNKGKTHAHTDKLKQDLLKMTTYNLLNVQV